MSEITGTTAGRVSSLSVTGAGPNSGELVFTIVGEAEEEGGAFRIGMDFRGSGNPDFSSEPQFFNAAASILAVAYQTKALVRVSWHLPSSGVPQTRIATMVEIPA